MPELEINAEATNRANSVFLVYEFSVQESYYGFQGILLDVDNAFFLVVVIRLDTEDEMKRNIQDHIFASQHTQSIEKHTSMVSSAPFEGIHGRHSQIIFQNWKPAAKLVQREEKFS